MQNPLKTWRWIWNAADYQRRVKMLAQALTARYPGPGWQWNGRWPIHDLINLAQPGEAPCWTQLTPTGCVGPNHCHPTQWIHIGGVAFNPRASVDMLAMHVGWRFLWHDTWRAGKRASWQGLRLLQVVEHPGLLADRLDSWIGIQLYSEYGQVHDKKPR